MKPTATELRSIGSPPIHSGTAFARRSRDCRIFCTAASGYWLTAGTTPCTWDIKGRSIPLADFFLLASLGRTVSVQWEVQMVVN